MYFLLQKTQDIIQTFPETQSPVTMQNTRKPYNSSGIRFLAQITRKLGSVNILMKYV